MKDKPWWKSLTVKGIIVGVVGFVLDPDVSKALVVIAPEHASVIAAGVRLAGAALAALGIRRALPGSDAIAPDRAPDDPRNWEYTFNKDGINPYGETAAEVFKRRADMDKVARDNRAALMGPHYTPPATE